MRALPCYARRSTCNENLGGIPGGCEQALATCALCPINRRLARRWRSRWPLGTFYLKARLHTPLSDPSRTLPCEQHRGRVYGFDGTSECVSQVLSPSYAGDWVTRWSGGVVS